MISVLSNGSTKTYHCSPSLLLRSSLAATDLLVLEVLVEQEKSLLVGSMAAHDCEHALIAVVVCSLSNGDASTRPLSDLADLATATTDDATDHIRRDANVLGADLLAVLCHKRDASVLGVAASAEALVAEISTVAGAGVVLVGVAAGAVCGVGADGRVVEDGACTALPIVNEALADLPNGLSDAVGGTLNLNDSLGGLREHFLLSNHANARVVLDVLNLQAGSADNGTHLVV